MAITWTLLLIGFAGGAWLHSCAVPASVGLSALGAFYTRTDRESPRRLVHAALCCIGIGAGCALLSAALLIMATGAAFHWWPAATEHPWRAVAVLLGLNLAFQLNASRRAATLDLLLVSSVVCRAGSNLGWAFAECTFAAAAALLLAWHAWHLMHDTASDLLKDA